MTYLGSGLREMGQRRKSPQSNRKQKEFTRS
jgi:hypothetical protein